MFRFMAFALLGLTFAVNGHARTGERFHIPKNNTIIYRAPSVSAPVVMRLNQGDRVVEWRRQGSWVKIGLLGGRVGKDGWVQISRLVSDSEGERKIEIEMDRAGRFRLDADVNGKNITFVVDTGATDIVLSPEDSNKLGFHTDLLNYDLRARTAGGIVRVARVVLNQISVGEFGFGRFTLRNVDALINEKQMRFSLLGMSFLKRLRSFEVRNNRLVMRW